MTSSPSRLLAAVHAQLPSLVALREEPFLAVLSADVSVTTYFAIRQTPVEDRLDDAVSEEVQKLRGEHISVRGVKQPQQVLDLGELGHVHWVDTFEWTRQLRRGAPPAYRALLPGAMYIAPSWRPLQKGWEEFIGTKGYVTAVLGRVRGVVEAARKRKTPSDQIVHTLVFLSQQLPGGPEANAVESLVALARSGEPMPEVSIAVGSRDAAATTLRRVEEKVLAEASAEIGLVGRSAGPGRGSGTPATRSGGEELWATFRRAQNIRYSSLCYVAQTGSAMYGVATPQSDRDYSAVYLEPTRSLLAPHLCDTGFQWAGGSVQDHADMPFGSDKAGVVEMSARELGDFVVELFKGNPRNIELLFAPTPLVSSQIWSELVALRRSFLTQRCVSQYLGFIADRLGKIEKKHAQFEGERVEPSKLLYHAYHKLLDLERVVRGQDPLVLLPEEERDFVLGIRRPMLQEEVAEHRQNILVRIEAVKDLMKSSTLAKEADFDAVIHWLRSVRVRCSSLLDPHNLLAVKQESSIGISPDVTPAIIAAVKARLDEIQQETAVPEMDEVAGAFGVKILFASERSSRVFGSSHAESDCDVKAIFVHPPNRYHALSPPATAFRRKYAATPGAPGIEIQGWELKQAVELLYRGNPAPLEALRSPVVYKDTGVGCRLRQLAVTHCDPSVVARAWWSHASGNYQKYIKAKAPGEVVQKSYGHVLRPLLCVLTLKKEDCQGWPKLDLPTLLNSAAVSDKVRDETLSLLSNATKICSAGPHRPVLDEFIEAHLGVKGHGQKPCPALPGHGRGVEEIWDQHLQALMMDIMGDSRAGKF